MLTFKARGLAAAFISCAMVLWLPPAPEALAQRVSAATTTLDAPKLSSKGAWSATANYVIGDLVTSRGSTWRAKRANSGKVPGSTDPLTVADWELLASGFNPRGAWLAGKTYHANDLATRAGSTWRAKRTSTGITPGASPQDWEQFAAAAMGAGPGSAPAGSAGAPAFSLSDDDTAESSRATATLPAVPKGSAGKPAFRFKGDTNTGLFSPGAGKIALVEDGVLFLHNKGTENTALGVGALLSNTGLGNTALGNLALRFNTTGSGNTAVGDMALTNSTTAIDNTAIGRRALLSTTTGIHNTAIGGDAMFNNTIGNNNTAVGIEALLSNTDGVANTAVGKSALESNTSGQENTALGHEALKANTTNGANTAVGASALLNATGGSNTAVGQDALLNNTTGSGNIALGQGAGQDATTSSNSIFIGNPGAGADTTTIKIGEQGTQTSAFIAGIRGVTTGVADAAAVLIDSAGQLGTVSSSRRYKEDIQSMGEVGAALMQLRPVTFRYKKPYDDGGKPIQYGLIAEEVAEVLPGLAVFNKDGQPETVKYHLLPSFLLAGYQQQQRTIAAQAERIDALEQRLRNIEALLPRVTTTAVRQ